MRPSVLIRGTPEVTTSQILHSLAQAFAMVLSFAQSTWQTVSAQCVSGVEGTGNGVNTIIPFFARSREIEGNGHYSQESIHRLLTYQAYKFYWKHKSDLARD